MSNSFYTSVLVHGSRILYRGIENGIKVKKKIDYHPTLYLSSPNPTQFTTVTGEYVSDIKPGNIRDCRDFIKQYEDVENFKIFGNQRYEYAFIADNFPDDVDWDRKLINVCNIDIEVGSENGFPEPSSASEPITAISLRNNSNFYVYGLGDFSHNRTDLQYIKCDDEIDLVKRFLSDWSLDYPDIMTGWNIKFFDIPYLVNRITKLLGADYAARLSPWNVIHDRKVNILGRDQIAYTPLGISTLDYIELYRRFAPGGNSQESYKLDHICHEELGERKLSYEEYGNLHTLYRDNHQKFIEYNIRDVELVDQLDDKLKLIDLALTLAYDSKSNYDDINSQVRMWDNIIFNHLKKQNKVIPPNESHTKDSAYVGAYVKEPMVGMHNWVVSFDLTSLYPSLIMQYNISPDKLINEIIDGVSIDTMLTKKTDTTTLKEKQLTLTPNGQLFKIDSKGFLSEIIEKMFNDRQHYKKKMIQSEKELELIRSEMSKRGIL